MCNVHFGMLLYAVCNVAVKSSIQVFMQLVSAHMKPIFRCLCVEVVQNVLCLCV